MSASPGPPEFLTTRQVAARWRVTPRTVERMAAAGDLPGVRLGLGSGVLRFRLDEVEAFESTRSAAA